MPVVAFPSSRAPWMYRDFSAVNASNVAHFPDGTSHRIIESILSEDQSSWRAERLGTGARELICRLYRPDLTALEAAALFWYARNSLVFERGLAVDPCLRACRHEDLLRDPGGVMRAVYAFLGRPWPGDRILRDVEPASARPARPVALAPAIAEACEGLLARLDAVPRITAGPAPIR